MEAKHTHRLPDRKSSTSLPARVELPSMGSNVIHCLAHSLPYSLTANFKRSWKLYLTSLVALLLLLFLIPSFSVLVWLLSMNRTIPSLSPPGKHKIRLTKHVVFYTRVNYFLNHSQSFFVSCHDSWPKLPFHFLSFVFSCSLRCLSFFFSLPCDCRLQPHGFHLCLVTFTLCI